MATQNCIGNRPGAPVRHLEVRAEVVTKQSSDSMLGDGVGSQVAGN